MCGCMWHEAFNKKWWRSETLNKLRCQSQISLFMWGWFFLFFFYRKFVNLIYVFERNLCMYIFMTILTTRKLKCSVFLWNTKSLKISTWLSRELSWVAANTNVSLLFGPTGIEPTISCILGEHANNYPTEVHNTNLKAGWIHALMRGKQFTALLVALAKWSKIFKIEECIFWQLWYI
jgi:hypothetical protein